MSAGTVIWHIFALIGAIKILYNLIPWLYWKLFCCVNLNSYKYGYVLITGATDGIGNSLAKGFLSRGFKVLLVSRSQSKLDSLKSELQFFYPQSSIEVVSADFSYSHRDSLNFYSELFEKLNTYPVSVLVNNVGVSDLHLLDRSELESLENMIGVNIYPMTMLTHQFIPVFLQRYRASKVKSLIINLSSTAEELIFPGSTVYAATKRFAAFFSEAIRYEYNEIEVVTVKPGAVRTQLILKNENNTVPLQVEPDSYAEALLSGLRTGVNHGHWKHKLLGGYLEAMPYLVNVANNRMMINYYIKKGLIR